MKKLNINLSKILLHCILVVIIGFISVIALIFILSRDLPSLEQLENYDPDLVTRIYSSDGVVLNELFVQKRVFIVLDQIPEHMLLAVVSSEDRKFFKHWGLSLRSVA